MISVDLHSHTNCSDGQLAPDQLIVEAVSAGVELFSITDHDTLAAYRLISDPVPESMRLVVGIELSCVWQRKNIHVVGLNVDPDSKAMCEAENFQAQVRALRFEKIIQRLQKAGMDIDSKQLTESIPGVPGRPHVARYLVESGQLKSETQAFDRYLGNGKMGDVKEGWPELDQAIKWIMESGGTAVLAHPIKYGLTRTKLFELATDFKDAGGAAIEVVSGKQTRDQTIGITKVAERLNLLGSVGSDFHKPGQPWARLGKIESLPDNIAPVWSQFC